MSGTVLCADADRHLCQILARALGADGVRVVAAHDGEEALRVVERAAPGLAILELGLPGRDGLEVLATIRSRANGKPPIPALLLAGGAPTAQQVERAKKLRANAILVKPVALDAIAARISKLLPGPRGPSAESERGKASRAEPLRGSLTELPFPALLHQAHGLRASGVLRLEDRGKRKDLELVDGRPASIRSNLAAERLGEWLLRTGRIRQPVLQESIQRMRRGEGLQGEILVAMQALSEAELAEALPAHADEKLFEIFEWPRGRFELVLGARLERASALAVARSPADVIRVGVHERFAIDRIDEVLKAHAGHLAFPGSSPFYSFQEIELGSEEQGLLGEAAKGLSIRALLGRGERPRRAAYALLECGLLELRDGASARTGGPAPRVRLHPTVAPASRTRAAAPPARPETPAPSSPPAAERPLAPEHVHYAADHEQRAALTALLVRLRRPSPFEKLGLFPDASSAEIRNAYTELAKRAHPDRFAGANEAVRGLAEEAFREITRAYELLSDPQRLEIYRRDPLRDAKDARAVEEAQRALSAEQEFQQGEARLRVYDWAGALARFERAVELYPDEGEYLAYCGWAYYLTHGHSPEVFRKAFELVKRGAKLAPERDKPYLFLGRLCQSAGRLELAERMFAKAIERRPDCTEALRELRLLAMRKPKKGLVRRLLRRERPE
jgi:CheY-like chemotaxis protein/tetratricopeptide (TPR) repeat protein